MNGLLAAAVAAAAALGASLAACGSPPAKVETAAPPAPREPTAQERFTAASEEFFKGYLDRYPTFGVSLGLHEYDGKLPDDTRAGIEATTAWLRDQKAVFEGMADAGLEGTAALEREVLLAQIRGDLFDLEVMRQPFEDPRYYVWSLDLSDYISRDYAPLADRARAVAAICDAAPAHLKAAEANLPEVMPRPWIDNALLTVNGMIDFATDDVATAFAELDDAELSARVSEALLGCGAALAGYRDLLKARMKSANDDFAIGQEAFLRMLADKEALEIDLARLEQIARADMDRNLGKLEIAARTIHKRKPIKAIIAGVMRDKPAASKLLDEATAQSAAMRQLLLEKDLVSIPSDDVAEVRTTPPFLRWNFAFLSAPGPFEKKPLPAFYYITPPDPKWPRKEQLAYIPARHDLLFTTIHEVWPGHFLHHLHGKQNPSRILRSFCSYAMSEGWAHYTEQLMLEAGAGGGDPRAEVGQLYNALLRNARFLSALGLHTGGMTVKQSMELFENRAYQDRATARQQATRGTFDPGYLNYTLGKLMILKLREDWKAKVGEGYSLKAFHDQFLSHGCAPVPVIRRSMLGPDAGPPL